MTGGRRSYAGPISACRSALDIDENCNPQGAVGNGRGDELVSVQSRVRQASRSLMKGPLRSNISG